MNIFLIFLVGISTVQSYNFTTRHTKVQNRLLNCTLNSTSEDIRSIWTTYYNTWVAKGVSTHLPCMVPPSVLDSTQIENIRTQCIIVKEINQNNDETHQRWHADLNCNAVFPNHHGGGLGLKTSDSIQTNNSVLETLIIGEEINEPTMKKRDTGFSIDWTNHVIPGSSNTNWITPVKNQGQSDACWAFSAVAATESAALISSLGAVNVSLSELDVVLGVSQNMQNLGYGNTAITCHSGGWDYFSYSFIQTYGVMLGSDLPFDPSCPSPSSNILSYANGKSIFQTVGAASSASGVGNINVLGTQPQTVMIYSRSNAFQYYSGGNLHEDDLQCGAVSPDHLVLLIAYNSTAIKIKNSWGKTWGNNGIATILTTTSLDNGSNGPCRVFQSMRAPSMKFKQSGPIANTPPSNQVSNQVTSSIVLIDSTSTLNPVTSTTPIAIKPHENIVSPLSIFTTILANSDSSSDLSDSTLANNSMISLNSTSVSFSIFPQKLNVAIASNINYTSLPPFNGSMIPYSIIQGDSCSSISSKAKVSISVFMSMNMNLNCTNLIPGAIVNVTAFTCTSSQLPYTIALGDTCSSITNGSSCTLNQLRSANPGLDCSNLQVGALVCVCPQTSTCPLTYTVQGGDTCSSISASLSIQSDVLSIMNQNFTINNNSTNTTNTTIGANTTTTPNSLCNQLNIGSTLCVPQPFTCPNGQIQRKLLRGDTCSQLIYNSSWSLGNFILSNPGISCSSLKVGNTVCLPIHTSSCPLVFTVKKLDTCKSIASQFNIMFPTLIMMNPGLDCALKIGDQLCVPSQRVCSDQYMPFTVSDGQYGCLEYLRYSTWTRGNFVAANPDLKCDGLLPGNIICLPWK